MVIQNMLHRIVHPAHRLCTLVASVTLCGLLAGFAAQVPSPPPEPVTPVAAVQSMAPVTAVAQTAAPSPAVQAQAAASQTPQSQPTQAAQPVQATQAAQAVAVPAPAPVAAQSDAPPSLLAADLSRLTAPLALSNDLEWFLDPSFTLTGEMVIKDHAQNFTPAAALPRAAGAVWLRVRIAPMPDGMNEQVYLYPGPGVPGALSVWMSRPGVAAPAAMRADEHNRYPLLYSRNGGAIYLRLEGWPAVGFAPWLGTDTDVVEGSGLARFVVLALLALASALCVLRGLAERRQWRVCAGLFALCVLIGGWWGLPSLAGGSLAASEIPAVAGPALALFFLPYAGRILMQPRNTMPGLDKLFLGAALLGLLLGLASLLPGQSWLLRYHTLWPLALAVCLMLCLPACRKGLAGCGRFFIACLLAVGGVTPLLVPLIPGRPELAPWFALAPLAGLTLSALLLALVGGHPSPRATVERRGSRRKPQMPQMPQIPMELDMDDIAADDDLPFSTPTPQASQPAQPAPAMQAGPAPKPEPLEMPNPAPPRAPAPAAKTPEQDSGEAAPRRTFALLKKKLPSIKAAPAPAAQAPQAPRPARPAATHPDPDPVLLTQLEETLRVPLDAVLRKTMALDMFDLPAEARAHLTELVEAGRNLSGIITNISRTGLPHPARVTIENAYIDLPLLLRNAHAAVAEEAENRNLAVSWYVAPHLGRLYTGPADRLSHVLHLLMKSAVQATERGSVQLWVRRVQESNEPGDLVFSVADTGSGMPPERRNPLLPATLWELVGETGGSLHIDSTPSGTTISFSISLKALPVQNMLTSSVSPILDLSEDDASLTLPSLRLILADDVPSRRQLLAYMLEDLPHELIEARTAAEATQLHSEIPARLIIFDGNMPGNNLVDAVAAIRTHEGEYELPPAVLLALVGHEAQGDRLRRAGVDHILYKPISRAILRQAVLHLAPAPGMELPPLPTPVAPHAGEEPTAPAPTAAPAASGETALNETALHEAAPSAGTPAVEPLALTPVAPALPATIEPLAAEHPESKEDLSLELLMPPRTARPDAKQQRKLGFLSQVLGMLPSRKKALPSVPSPDDAPAAKAAGPAYRPVSRNVGEPTPVPRSAARPAEPEAQTPRPRKGETAAPRIVYHSDDSHLSENGVGNPMPITRSAPEAGFSENGVSEPMPILKPTAVNAEASASPAPTPEQTPASAPDTVPSSPRRGGSLLDLIEEVGPVSADFPTAGEASAPISSTAPTEQAEPVELTELTELVDASAPLEPVHLDVIQPETSPAEAVQDAAEPGPDDEVFTALLQSLDDGLDRIQDGLDRHDIQAVVEATGSMAEQAESYGLFLLARHARDMRGMASAPDGLEAAAETMHDLRTAVERNRNSFSR